MSSVYMTLYTGYTTRALRALNKLNEEAGARLLPLDTRRYLEAMREVRKNAYPRRKSITDGAFSFKLRLHLHTAIVRSSVRLPWGAESGMKGGSGARLCKKCRCARTRSLSLSLSLSLCLPLPLSLSLSLALSLSPSLSLSLCLSFRCLCVLCCLLDAFVALVPQLFVLGPSETSSMTPSCDRLCAYPCSARAP